MKTTSVRETRKCDSTYTVIRTTGRLFLSARQTVIAATLITLFLANAPALAQSCDAPGFLPSTPVPPLTGTTCGGEQVAPSLCDGQINNPGPNYVIQFVLHNPGGHLVLTGEGPFLPSMYLSSADESCTSGPCVAVGDWATPISFAGLPAGSYRLIIAADPNDTAGTCGVFTLRGDDAFYASENDYIFADGFD